MIIKAWSLNHRSAFDASGLIKTSLSQLGGVTPEVVLRLRRDWRRRDLGEFPGEFPGESHGEFLGKFIGE